MTDITEFAPPAHDAGLSAGLARKTSVLAVGTASCRSPRRGRTCAGKSLAVERARLVQRSSRARIGGWCWDLPQYGRIRKARAASTRACCAQLLTGWGYPIRFWDSQHGRGGNAPCRGDRRRRRAEDRPRGCGLYLQGGWIANVVSRAQGTSARGPGASTEKA